MLVYWQGQAKTSSLDKSLKNNCSKADCKTSKIKTIVKQIWIKANKNYFANRPNQGLPNHQFVLKHIFLESSLCIYENCCRKDKDTPLLLTTALPNLAFFCAKNFLALAPNTSHNQRIHQVIVFHSVIKQ